METTNYFRNDVLVKRPYIKPKWLELALTNPLRREVQLDDGRIRQWVWIDELIRYLRVVTLEPRLSIRRAFGTAWVSAAHLRPFLPLFVANSDGY